MTDPPGKDHWNLFYLFVMDKAAHPMPWDQREKIYALLFAQDE